MRVVCVGDIMLDVIVSTAHPLAPDDDTPAAISFAPGGQAANVAAWVVALGGEAVVLVPRVPGRVSWPSLRSPSAASPSPARRSTAAALLSHW